MTQELSLGISPCPNDTYIFYAMVHERIDLAPFSLQTTLADVQELNQAACTGGFDLVKISAAAFGQVQDQYTLLRAGGALGRGCGPLLVARPGFDLAKLPEAMVALPGDMTTASLLLRLHGLHQGHRKELRYDRIMTAVASGEVEVGLVIHEGRFTYPAYGLEKILDLGQWWETETGLPIPLGVIAVKSELGPEVAAWAEDRIRASLAYARAHQDLAWPFIQSNAQEMDAQTISEHIQTFVTEFSWDLGEEGLKAVHRLLRAGTV